MGVAEHFQHVVAKTFAVDVPEMGTWTFRTLKQSEYTEWLLWIAPKGKPIESRRSQQTEKLITICVVDAGGHGPLTEGDIMFLSELPRPQYAVIEKAAEQAAGFSAAGAFDDVEKKQDN